jgi:hypothetical protein
LLQDRHNQCRHYYFYHYIDIVFHQMKEKLNYQPNDNVVFEQKKIFEFEKTLHIANYTNPLLLRQLRITPSVHETEAGLPLLVFSTITNFVCLL